MKRKLIIIYTLIAITATACKKDEPEAKLVLPSALTLTIQQDTSDPRAITLGISAEDANYYQVYFGDTANEIPLNTTQSLVEHTYASAGTYTIKVQAHTTSSAFITATTEVSIALENGSDGGIPTTGYSSPESYEGMQLVWQDEFNGEELNPEDWTFETGTGENGWGNDELQYYREENTTVEDGYLIITAKEEAYQGRDYTSSRIKTQNKQSFQYGRIDIRAALPQGQGIWPALWMLGSDFSTVGWPASGEIDIMEMIGGSGRENTVHGTIHWDNAGEYASYGGDYSLDAGIFADEFHVFSLVWNEHAISWLVDDEQFHTVDITPADLSEFQQEFFLIFNVAVGGRWPGNPDAGTSFPQQMVVDYVRVFQQDI